MLLMSELNFRWRWIRRSLLKVQIVELTFCEYNIDELVVNMCDMLIAVEL